MEILQNLHSYFAYIVLAIPILAVFNALSGWLGKRDFTMHKDLRLSLFALILSHIQLVVGLVLYFVSANGFKAIQTLLCGKKSYTKDLYNRGGLSVNSRTFLFLTS